MLRDFATLFCRDRARGEAAQAEIKTKSGNPAVDLLLADLSAQQSIRQLAENFQQRYTQLHVLINNAGLFVLRRRSKELDNKTEEQ
jgi:short-subunit dehydrogenase